MQIDKKNRESIDRDRISLAEREIEIESEFRKQFVTFFVSVYYSLLRSSKCSKSNVWHIKANIITSIPLLISYYKYTFLKYAEDFK